MTTRQVGSSAWMPCPCSVCCPAGDAALREVLTIVLLIVLLIALLPLSRAIGEDAPVEELLRKAGALQQAYEFRAEEKLLRRVLAKEPLHMGARLGLASTLNNVGEGAVALALVRETLALYPERPEPQRALGFLLIRAEGPVAARACFEKALSLKADDAVSMRGLAKAALRAGEMKEADRQLRRAEALTPDDSSLLFERAKWLSRTGETNAAARICADLLVREPWSLGPNAAVANGMVLKGRPLYQPSWTPVPYNRKVQRAARLYRERRLDEAEAHFSKLDTEEAYDGRPAFYRGLVALRSGKTRVAIGHMQRAVEREPDNFLFRNGYVKAVKVHITHQRIEHGGGVDGVDRITPLAALIYREAEIPGVERFVRGYDALLARERQVILRAVRPFKQHLERLLEQGMTHDIIGLEERIGEAVERQEYREGRSHDGRWLPAVRGLGGLHAATGLEFVIDAAELGDDVFAHEFAHQVHLYAMTHDQRAEIKRLYRAAVVQGRALTPYARTNDREYFAVAYEAFVSLAKSPWQVAHHDRAELRVRDPKLYEFLIEATGTPDIDPAVQHLREPILAFYEAMGHPERLKRVRALFPESAATR